MGCVVRLIYKVGQHKCSSLEKSLISLIGIKYIKEWRGVEDMSETVTKTKIIETMEKGVNALKDSHTRRIVGVIIFSLGGGLIASSYV